ncbi:MAG: 5'-nucleotidase [Gammaproteobacteria bacterium]|nr:5'-nucleotidase [Gammaproteobacteria bacterium]
MKETIQKLVIGVTSRSLFDLSESHRVFNEQGIDAFAAYQVENEDKPLKPGSAFPLVQKFLSLNSDGIERCEVVLLSRNSMDTGLRVFNSIAHHNLTIIRAAFCSGRNPWPYARAFSCDLYLSTESEDVRNALKAGVPAAQLVGDHTPSVGSEVRIAFDGDAVLFSDEAERIFHHEGLQAFQDSETLAAKTPLSAGPFKQFLFKLHELQSTYPPGECPIKTALVTARSAPSHERVVRTLREWGIRVDECVFLGGLPKSSFLAAFDADIFFDDQVNNVRSVGTGVGAHVVSGIKNEY